MIIALREAIQYIKDQNPIERMENLQLTSRFFDLEKVE